MAKPAESAGSDITEMKALFKLAHSKPVNVAFALGGDGKAIIKLDKMQKPKALGKTLKDSDPKIKNVRCGTVEIDSSDASTANFTMDKAVSGFDGKLIVALKGTGVSKVNITVGGDDAGSADGQAADDGDDTDDAASTGGATAAGQPSPPADVNAGADAASAATSAASPPPPAPPPPAPPVAATSTPATPQASPAAPGQDVGAMTAQLTGLVKQMITAISGNPALKATLAPLATSAQGALKQGNLQEAAASIASLQQALAGGGGAPATGAGGPPPPPNAAAMPPQSAAAPDAPPPPAGDAVKPSDTPAGKAHAKAGIVWKATHAKMTGDIDKLTSQFSAAFKDHAQAAELQKGFKAKIDGVLGKLDQSLSSKLAELDGAKDSAAHTKIVADAKKILAQYQQVVSSDPTIAQIDKNPFAPIALEKTLTTTLSTLAKVLV